LLEIVEVLTRSDVDNWTLSRCYSRESSTTLGMAIELGDDYLTNLDSVVESLCLSVTGLTNASVHDEDRSVRFDCSFNLEHLVEKRLLLLVSS
jgi:hypothetical protein